MQKKWTPAEIAAVIGALVLAAGAWTVALVQSGRGPAPQQPSARAVAGEPVPGPTQRQLSLPVGLDRGPCRRQGH